MPNICYVEKNFQPATMQVIEQANIIINEYEAQGFSLTLRQLYYQFVSRDLIRNSQREYKRLGSIVNDGRLAGLIDWDAIEDRTRNLMSLAHWDTPASIVQSISRQFRIDRWEGQPFRPEVWIEKDALVGVIEGVCNRNDVPFFSCRGYTSQSELWGAAQRLGSYAAAGQQPVIIHLGDHDPSGIDMTRDIEDRLNLFMGQDFHNNRSQFMHDEIDAGRIAEFGFLDLYAFANAYAGADEEVEGMSEALDALDAMLVEEFPREADFRPEVVRIALNMDQVHEYEPPPNPTKLSDSRSSGYVETYGHESWELDALDPATLAALIEDEIISHRDDTLWDESGDVIEEGRRSLRAVSSRWEDVVDFVTTADEDEER